MTAAVAVVADGGDGAGLGHVARCTAIVAALRARGVAVRSRALGASRPYELDGVRWEPLAAVGDLLADLPAVVVLDSYRVVADDAADLAQRCVLAVLHDEGAPLPGTRLVVSVGGVPSSASCDAVVLAGLRFAALRTPFWELPTRRVRPVVERVLVAAGSGVLGTASVAVANVVRTTLPGCTVALVRGPLARFEAPPGVELVQAPSLAGELLAADLVVSAAGQTALEAAATGAPCLALPLVPNQRGNAAALAAAGAARVIAPADVPVAVAELAADRVARERLAARAQAEVDGRGAQRIALRLEQLAGA